jgi:pimeloyl-ACP methyl ester carboxylesterase
MPIVIRPAWSSPWWGPLSGCAHGARSARRSTRSRGSRGWGLLASLLAALLSVALSAGCTAPVGVKHIPPQDQNREFTRNALNSDSASDVSRIVLRRYDLVETFDQHPASALAELREVVTSGRGGNDELFALAELSYLHAATARSRPDALAAAAYAYALLFPDDPSQRLQPIDPRYRWACDIYAEGLTETLREPEGRAVSLQGGTYTLPFGTLVVDFDTADLRWGGRTLSDFLPVSEYEVQGMRNHYRQHGIGVALAAKTVPGEPGDPSDAFIARRLRVPATLFLRLDNPRQQLADSELHGRLELYAATDREAVTIDGAHVPLEVDRTAAVATTLAETAFWNRELSAFLGNAIGVHQTARLVTVEPYRPGRIPVVFVHGTNSSPGRWADMENDLQADARIRHGFQFWFFMYDSGNPIAYSAMHLRQALRDAVARFDPGGRDPCLRHMVVVGHSQGGLLTKMTAIDSGSLFWDNVSGMPFDQVRLTDRSRALLKEALFVKPLPSVDRVVFIATPHRGSYLAGSELVRRLAAKLISMPHDLVMVSTDILAIRDPANRMLGLQLLPTSIDNMSPGNRFIKTLSSIPIAPGVHAHSIIPVEGDGPLEDEVDGVVAYKSAHIDGVDSELVVRHSSHSTQSNPRTIDEVHRILLLQAESNRCAGAPPARATAHQSTSQ